MTAQQITALETEIGFAIQKIERWRSADSHLREYYKNATLYTPSAIRRAENEVKHAEGNLVAALDELRDEIDPLIKAATAATAT